jgi:P4 family phage/plasmid primase-like protien
MTRNFNSVAEAAVSYVKLGWQLCSIPAGAKGPPYTGWNLPENVIKTTALAQTLVANVGLCHLYSGTCCIDIDDLAMAADVFAGRGIDIMEYWNAPDAVRISSGRPNRGKLLFRLPPGVTVLHTRLFLKWGFELRCASSKGLSVQDVLPPSVHVKTGQPYTWEGEGDIADLPALPPEIHDWWIELTAKSERGEVKPSGVKSPALQALLDRINPSGRPYDEWLNAGMALHFETRAGDDGLALWEHWSSRSDKYAEGAQEMKWPSFHLDHPNPRTIATLRAMADEEDMSSEYVVLPPDPAAGKISASITARHLCSDLANAKRVCQVFGHKLMVSAGRCFHWTETHWAHDEGTVYRCASKVSEIIHKEETHWRNKPTLTAEESKSNGDIADALHKWAKQSEMKAKIDATFGLLKKLLNVDPLLLDADPWALNTISGTVDLRTGLLKKHDPADRITLCVPVRYVPGANAPRFARFLDEITGGDKPLQNFLRRWYGYAATGSTREQKFVVKTGPGANGKGTLTNACDAVLGPYACPAPPNLLTGTNATERHPTEIADLLGRRLVTASETEDGAFLRESFVKLIVGGDTLKGRFMRGDFFQFRPTFKLQLLTNHLPQVRGTDYAIWRRTLIVHFPVRFGSQDDVRDGRADQLRDDQLEAALIAEREGILAWIVEGAREWNAQGLRPPDHVLASVRQYQAAQDRTQLYIEECCELRAGAWTSVAMLYEDYVRWAKAAGYVPQGRNRFLEDVTRVASNVRRETQVSGPRDQRRKHAGLVGLEIATEFATLH